MLSCNTVVTVGSQLTRILGASSAGTYRSMRISLMRLGNRHCLKKRRALGGRHGGVYCGTLVVWRPGVPVIASKAGPYSSSQLICILSSLSSERPASSFETGCPHRPASAAHLAALSSESWPSSGGMKSDSAKSFS